MAVPVPVWVICTANRSNANENNNKWTRPLYARARAIPRVSHHLCPQFKQRTRWSTKLFWNNNNFLNEFIFCFAFSLLLIALQHTMFRRCNIFFHFCLAFLFLFLPYGHGAWCALFVDCGITSSTIYYWIFILGFSIDNNMCEYGFSLLFRLFFSPIRFITLIAQHLMFMCGTCFVFGFLVIFCFFHRCDKIHIFIETRFSKFFFQWQNEIVVLFCPIFAVAISGQVLRKYRVRKQFGSKDGNTWSKYPDHDRSVWQFD